MPRIAFSLIALIIALTGLGVPARAGQITMDQAPVTTLADGRTGTLAFEALTPKGSCDFVARQVAQKSVITGVLTLPDAAKTPGVDKVPAMVVVHGSSGVLANEWEWAKRMNELGYASFVIDNFTGRGLTETATDQSQLSTMADVAGALAALKLLATHPAIDVKRIGVIGFSRGGSVAIDFVFEPIRRAVIDNDLRFAVHIPVYVGCSIGYMSAHLDGSPILMLLGGKDDYTPATACVAYADVLRAKGASIKVVVYPNAYHGFDGLALVKFIDGARPCAIVTAASTSMPEPSSRCCRTASRSRARPPSPSSSAAPSAA